MVKKLVRWTVAVQERVVQWTVAAQERLVEKIVAVQERLPLVERTVAVDEYHF